MHLPSDVTEWPGDELLMDFIELHSAIDCVLLAEYWVELILFCLSPNRHALAVWPDGKGRKRKCPPLLSQRLGETLTAGRCLG